MKASFRKNWRHYLQEALGLAIFMISACFFSALMEAKDATLHQLIPQPFARNVIMGIMMGSTALLIFYSPFTAPSGAHINPAVSLSFLRIGKIDRSDALFYCLFQFLGGTFAVYLMQLIMGASVINPPVNSAVTIPTEGVMPALVTEFIIAFITMTMVLFTSNNPSLRKYTRLLAGGLVCVWVILAGPISGFGMNPARSFASALPANIWTDFWIYLLIPIAAMLLATECFIWITIKNRRSYSATIKKELQ